VTHTCALFCLPVEYDVPENHSTKDYIQMLISGDGSMDITIGSYQHVPAESHGQVIFSTQDIPSSSTIRFVYVKTGTAPLET
jgi:hypothetical protein